MRPVVFDFPRLALAGSSPAEAATYKGGLRAAISKLPVARATGTKYYRDDFKLWIDSDSDSCDTGDEAPIAEAVKKPVVGSGCTLTGGQWKSYYDGVTTTNPSTFDIDHTVPLAEAWDSGASTLGEWEIRDDAGASYTFPNVSLAPAASLRLVTGSGGNSTDTLYAGKGTSRWNKFGDTFYLYNPSAQLKQTGHYIGAGDGGVANF